MAMQDEALGSLKIDVGHYVDVLKRGAFKIAFLTCLFLLIGLSLASFWPATYESTTKVALKEFKIIDDSDLFKSTAQLPIPQKNQVLQSFLTSSSYIKAVLEQLDWVDYGESNSDPASRAKFLSRVASHIVPSVKTDITGASLVEIAFTWTSPIQARDFVARLRDHWIDQVLESYKRTHRDQLLRMETLLAAHQNDSRNAQEQLDDFQATHSLPLDLTQDYKLNLQKQLTSSITTLEAEITGSEQKLKSLEEALGQTPKEKETKVQAANPDYVIAQNKVLAAQKTIESYKTKGYTPKHPYYQRASLELQSSVDELNGLKKFIENEVTTEPNPDYNKFYQDYVVGKADHEGKLKVLKEQKNQLETVEKEIKDLPVLQNELDRLKNEVKVRQDIVDQEILQITPMRNRVNSFQQTNPAAGGDPLTTGVFEVLDEPVAAASPSKPMAIIFIAASFVFGLALGLVLVLAGDTLRQTLTSTEEVRKLLSLPVLAAISPIATEIEVRRARLQRILSMALATMILFAFGASIYVCTFHAEVLPQNLVAWVTDLKKSLG